MQLAKRVKRAIIGSLILATLVVAGWYHAKLYLAESHYTSGGTYSYHILISDAVKALPLYEPVPESVRYHYSVGDGVKPAGDTLHYQSIATTELLLEKYDTYFRGRNYSPINEDYVTSNLQMYGNEQEEFGVYVVNHGAVRQVAVEHVRSAAHEILIQ